MIVCNYGEMVLWYACSKFYFSNSSSNGTNDIFNSNYYYNKKRQVDEWDGEEIKGITTKLYVIIRNAKFGGFYTFVRFDFYK